MPALPDSASLALWLSAWLAGQASPDAVRDAVVGADAAHDVGFGEESLPLVLALGRLRGAGARGASLALPVPGDLLGLAGPADTNAAALETGEAVVVWGADLALVPWRAGAGVVWSVLPARTPVQVPDVFEAGATLRTRLAGAAEGLAALDLARWRPELADELHDLRRPHRLPMPPGTPERVESLLALAARCRRIVELALQDEPGVSAYEIDRRRAVLDDLDAAARRAMVAACAGQTRRDG